MPLILPIRTTDEPDKTSKREVDLVRKRYSEAQELARDYKKTKIKSSFAQRASIGGWSEHLYFTS